ncbi:MAG: hypothetical protein H0W21_07365, partial [Actinobacteria bacterium]|nr:hypothetical protein [Actinomycetota bacterium]
MKRLVESIDDEIPFEELGERFSASKARQTLLGADVVVECVDSFAARDQITSFYRGYHFRLIDIGMNVETDDGGRLVILRGRRCHP